LRKAKSTGGGKPILAIQTRRVSPIAKFRNAAFANPNTFGARRKRDHQATRALL
jgi:hypothetical protein